MKAEYTINGQNVEVEYLKRDGIQDILSEVFVSDCYQIGNLFKSGFDPKLVVDVGTHMGFFGKLVHAYWPECKVIGFEPEKELYEVASRNNGGNVWNFAVRYDGRNDFYISPKTGGSVVYDATVNFSETIPLEYIHRRVLTVPLEIIQGEIDLLKLDCEGSEFDILCGMTEPMRKRIKRIVGEYHHLSGFRFIQRIIEIRFPHLKPRLLGNDPELPIAMFEA